MRNHYNYYYNIRVQEKLMLESYIHVHVGWLTSRSSKEYLVVILKPGCHVVGIQDGNLQIKHINSSTWKFRSRVPKCECMYIQVLVQVCQDRDYEEWAPLQIRGHCLGSQNYFYYYSSRTPLLYNSYWERVKGSPLLDRFSMYMY